MARYEVQGPDGGRYEVEMPDGMSQEQLGAALTKHFESLGIKATRMPDAAAPAPAPAAPVVDANTAPTGGAGRFAPPVAMQSPFPGVDFAGPVPDVRKAIAALPAEKRNDALKTWAKIFVSKERAGGGVKQGGEDVLTNLFRGVVGPWMDEADGALAAARYAVGLGGAPYDEARAYSQAKAEAIDRDSTKLGSVPVPIVGDVDVTAGGLTKLAGGVAAAPFLPAVRAMQGATMLPQVANAAATGAVYGGVLGAGEGDGAERIVNSGIGAGIGAGLGAAAPPIARGISNLTSRAPRPQGAIADMNPRSVANLADDFRADGINPQAAQARFGPEGMVADLGPNLQGHIGGIARLPGEGQTIAANALGRTVSDGRRAGAADRIRADVDAVAGPAQNLVALGDDVLARSRELAAPYYREFYATPIQPTPRLQQFLGFAEENGITRAADAAMAREGLLRPGVPVSPNMRIDYISRELNRLADFAGTPAAGLDRAAAAQWRQIANAYRAEVDGILRAQDAARRGVAPRSALSSWDMARRHAGSGLQFEEGLTQGAEAFKKGTHPDQMRADIAGMTPFEDNAFRIGARGAIRDIMGNSGTAFGPNGDSAAMRALGSEFARDKLGQIVGPGGAQRLVGRLGNEATFEQTRQAAFGNSVTAAMQQSQKRYTASSGVDRALDPTIGMLGTAKQAARWLVNKATGGFLDERKSREAVDAARMLTATGDRRDEVIREIAAYANRRDATANQRRAAETLLQALMEGARPTAITSTVSAAEAQP